MEKTVLSPAFGIAAIVLFSLVNLAIGLYQKSGKPISLRNYTSFPNQANYFMVVLSVTSTIVGGGMFFAVSQLGYETGVSGIYLGASYFFGLCFLGGLAPLIRKKMADTKSQTLYEFIDACFPSSTRWSPKVIFAFATLIIFFMFLGAQILTLSYFITYIYDLPSTLSVVVSGSTIFLINSAVYTLVGGLQKDIVTDIWQMLLVSIGVVLIIIAIDDLSRIKLLDNEYFIGTKAGPVLLAGIFFFAGPALLARPDMWQRITASKSDKVAKWSFITAAVLSLLVYCLFTLVGMYANVEGWDSGTTALFTLLGNESFSYFSVAITLSFLGAVISSADTFLNICAISIREIATGTKIHLKSDIRMLRISTLVSSLLALLVAFGLPDLVDLFVGGFGALLIFLPIVFGALFGQHRNSKAAVYGSSIGLLIYFCSVWFIPREAFLPAVIASAAVYYYVSGRAQNAS